MNSLEVWRGSRIICFPEKRRNIWTISVLEVGWAQYVSVSISTLYFRSDGIYSLKADTPSSSTRIFIGVKIHKILTCTNNLLFSSRKPWLLQDHYASGCRGLLGNEELTGKKCTRIAERFAGNSSLSEGLDKGKGNMVISSM